MLKKNSANRKRITRRTAERFRRLAYDLEALVPDMRAEGFDSLAEGIRDCASTLGYVARHLREHFEGNK